MASKCRDSFPNGPTNESGGEGTLKPFEPDLGWRERVGPVYEFPVAAVTNYYKFCDLK